MIAFLFIIIGIFIVYLLIKLSDLETRLRDTIAEMRFLQQRIFNLEHEQRPQEPQGEQHEAARQAPPAPEAKIPPAAPPVVAPPSTPAPKIADRIPPILPEQVHAAQAAEPKEQTTEPPTPQPQPEPAHKPLIPPLQPKPAPVPEPPSLLPEPVPVPTPPSPQPQPAPAPTPPRWTLPTTREGWEELIGGNIFNRIGAIAVVIGLALALLYAIQVGLITPPLRIALGYLAGVGLLVLGYITHRRGVPTFAQGLIGAGIAICYLCGYASYVPGVVGAFDADPMVSYPVAFVLMTAAAILAFQQAILYDSLAVALLGWVGGFLTPFILRSGNDNVLGLLTYLAFLALGMVALVIWRDRWAILEPLTLVTTYLIYFTLSLLMPGAFSSVGNAPIAAVFLLTIWAMFHAADLIRTYRGAVTFSEMRQTFAVINLALMWMLLYVTLDPHFHRWIAAISLGLGLVYFIGALAFTGLRREENRFIPRGTVSAIVLLALATHFAFQGFTRITAWSLEATAILWAGLHWRRSYAWVSALYLFGVAFILLLFVPNAFFWLSIDSFTPVFNPRVLAFLTLAGGLLAAALRFRNTDGDTGQLRAVLHYGWISLVFTLLAVEINDYFRYLYQSAEGTTEDWVTASRMLTIALSWVIFSLPLLGIGLRARLNPLIVSGLLAGTAGALLAIWEGVRLWAYLDNPLPALVMRGIVLLLIITALFFHANWTRRERENYPWLGGVDEFMHVLIAVLGFELITLEALDVFSLLAINRHIMLLGMSLQYARDMMLAVAWSLYGLGLIRSGLWRNSKALQYCGFISLVPGIAALLIGGWSFEPVNAFIPILNLRTLAFGLVIISIYLVDRLARERRLAFNPAALLQIVMAVLAFEWLTAEIIGTFNLLAWRQHNNVLGMGLPQARDLALAVGWSLYAAAMVWIGQRRSLRTYEYCGFLALLPGIAWLVMGGIIFLPIEAFLPVLNARTIAIVIVIACLYFIERLMRKRETGFRPLAAMQVVMTAIAFGWVTAEINDGYRLLAAQLLPVNLRIDPEQAKLLTLAMGWAMFAVVASWIAARKRATAMFCFALLTGALALATLLINGMSYQPPGEFFLLLNLRSAAFAIVIAAFLVLEQLLKRRKAVFPWIGALPTVLYVVTALLILLWVSVECWAYFAGELTREWMPDAIAQLQNFRQMSLSITWVVYAILVISYGFVRRIITLRLLGIAVFEVAIFKIFIFDFANLDTLFRIFSFIGLGIMLLLTSYLYQRYKQIILGAPIATSPTEPPEAPPTDD